MIRHRRESVKALQQRRLLPNHHRHDLTTAAATTGNRNSSNDNNIQLRATQRPSELLGITRDIPISWIDIFVAFAVSFQSVLNGLVFVTGTLLMFQEYDLSRSLIGFVYSCSAIAGAIASVLPMNDRFVDLFQRKLPSPHNFFFFLFGCTYLTIMTAIPNFIVYLIGFLFINFALGLFVSYLAELQGRLSTTENYQQLAPYAQLARRLSALLILCITPILYNVMPRLPNIVGACVSFLFTLAIYIGFERARYRSYEELVAHAENNVHGGSTALVLDTVVVESDSTAAAACGCIPQSR